MNTPTSKMPQLPLNSTSPTTHFWDSDAPRGVPWGQTLRTLAQRFREDRLGLSAGSLTFTTLISLVPLLTVMLAVFSAFPMFSAFQVALQKYFLQSLVPDHIARPVLAALTQFSSKASRLGTVGLVAFLFSALALMLTIDRTLGGIWRVDKPRPLGRRLLVYWALATLGPLILGGSLALTSVAISASRGWLGASPVWSELLGSASTAMVFVLFTLGSGFLFYYLPNTQVRWRHALMGGLFVALALEVVKRALGWYLKSVPTYSVVFGAFATVPIFLVWLYLVWVIVLLGAVIAAYAPSLEMRVVRHEEHPGYRFSLAVAMLSRLYGARGTEARGCRPSELARALKTDPLQIQTVVQALQGMNWVGQLSEEGEPRLVLLCDPLQTGAAPLMAQFLMTPAHEPPGFGERCGFNRMPLMELLQMGELPAASHSLA
jgi:membrane protein